MTKFEVGEKVRVLYSSNKFLVDVVYRGHRYKEEPFYKLLNLENTKKYIYRNESKIESYKETYQKRD